jgi:hypothetical protein
MHSPGTRFTLPLASRYGASHAEPAVSPWEFAVWGAFGGLAVEAIQFYGAIRRTGRWPWRAKGEPGPGPLLVSVLIRVGVGLGLAWAAGATNQIGGPLAAIAVGVAAPLIIEQMARRVPVEGNAPEGAGSSDAS